MYYLHAEHNPAPILARYIQLKNNADLHWEIAEETEYLWSALLLSKDHSIVKQVIGDKVEVPSMVKTYISAYSFTFLFKMRANLMQSEDELIKEKYTKLNKKLKRLCPYSLEA